MSALNPSTTIYIKYTDLVQFLQFVRLLNRLNAFTVFEYVQNIFSFLTEQWENTIFKLIGYIAVCSSLRVLRSNSCNFFKDLTRVVSSLSFLEY